MEAFAPVMRLETFRLLIALATKLDLLIHVVDVVGAYLNGSLKETIYMAQPPDYDNGTGQVCLLLRPLYGLKQAGRAWNEELNQKFLEIGFNWLFSDQCVYICHQDHELALASVHIDDITILGSDTSAIKWTKTDLEKYFTITDLGEAKQVVGLELERNLEEGTLKILQEQYIKNILENLAWQTGDQMSTIRNLFRDTSSRCWQCWYLGNQRSNPQSLYHQWKQNTWPKALLLSKFYGLDPLLLNLAFPIPDQPHSMLIIKGPLITQIMPSITATLNTLTYNTISSTRKLSLTRLKFSTVQPKIT